MNNGNAPFFHGDQGLIRPQGYRPDHLEQVRRANAEPAPIPQANVYFPPIPYRRPAQQNLMPGWNNQGFQAPHQQVPGGLHFGNPALVNPQDFHGQHAPDFAIEEEVPYGDPVIPNTQQQSTSGGPSAKPVADISAHSADNQGLLMSIYGDRFDFTSSVPSAARRAVSPVAGAIPPQAVTPGPRQGPSSGSFGSIVSLTRGSPNEVAPLAPAAPRAIAPPGFFPPAPNTPQFMPPPPFNMTAGGNFWNPGMHPMDHMAMLLRESIAKNKRLEEELATLKRQFGVQSNPPPGKKRRQEEPTTSAKIKEEPADDEEVEYAGNHRASASRTIKKEPLDLRRIQPIPQPAPNADLVVLAEIRPEIRRYKTIAEAIKVAGDEFSTEYFSDKFEKFNLPIAISFSEFFSEFLFCPTLLASRPQMPQIVKRNLAYPKLMYDYIFRGETEETRKAKWTEEEKKRWAPAFKELAKVQLEQRRAGLIIWKEQRSTAKKQREE